VSAGDASGCGVRGNIGLSAFGGTGSLSVFMTRGGGAATVIAGPGTAPTVNFTVGCRH
jgi:hypothetical protein